MVETWAQRRLKAHPPDTDRSMDELSTEPHS
jgi:hypothetical protein